MDVVINGTQTAPPADSKAIVSQGSYALNLLACLGFAPTNPPLADFLRLYHDLEGRWLVASPIHWQATHNDAMLMATGSDLELSEDESLSWFNEVAEFLKADGFSPRFLDAQTWLFRVDNQPIIDTKPPHCLIQHSLMPSFKIMDNTLFWQRLITELQMYLSEHPLNKTRKGLCINGLWFWGAGEFAVTNKKKIVCDDPQLNALLKAQGQQISLLTESTILSKEQLVVINQPKPTLLQLLHEKTKKNTVRWYWSDLAYLRQASHWWSKLDLFRNRR